VILNRIRINSVAIAQRPSQVTPAAASRAGHEMRGDTKKRLDRLRAQFDAADAELHAVPDDLVYRRVPSAEVVRHVHANHHAANLRVRPGLKGRN
jgi:hypothetical protein